MAPTAPPRTYRILLAEDDAQFLGLLERSLQKRRYETVGKRTGPEALEALREGGFDVLVLDILLPGMLGLEVIKRMKEEDLPQQPKVVIASGLYQAKNQERFFRSHLGVSGFLRKPFSLGALYNAVEKALDEKYPERVAEREKVKPAPRSAAPVPAGTRDEDKQFEAVSDKARLRFQRALKSEPVLQGRPVPEHEVRMRFRSPADFMREYADNIGSGGLFVSTSEPLPVGQRVRLTLSIPFPGGRERDVPIPAEVVYIRTAAQGGAGMGVHLTSISDQARAIFEDAIKQAHADARAGRPLFIIAYGVGPVLDMLMKAVPESDLRVSIPETYAEVKQLARSGTADMVILGAGADADAASDVLRTLKRDPETARIPVLVFVPRDTRNKLVKAGADRCYDMEDGEEKLVRDAAGIVHSAQRRKHIRVRFDSEMFLRTQGLSLPIRAQDLSEGGLAATVKTRLDLGETMVLEIPLPDGEDSLVEPVMVAWEKPVGSSGAWALGLQFSELSEDGTRRIRAFVEEALRLANYIRWMGAGVAAEQD